MQLTFTRGTQLCGQKRICVDEPVLPAKVQRVDSTSLSSPVSISRQLSELELAHMIDRQAPSEGFAIS